MKRTLLLLAVLLALAGCAPNGGADMDKYVRNHEPKTGGPDL
jgi:hypothetical protein